MRTSKPAAELGFDRYDASRLRKAISQVEDKRTYVRLQAVLLIAKGEPVPSVCRILGCASSTLYRWIRLYLQTHRPTSLFDAPRSGRPRAAAQITDKRILKELARSPMSLGYMVTTWTVATLAHHLSRRYHNPINAHTLYRRMKAMGLQYKRPKYIYEEKAPHRAQKKGLSSES